MTPGAQEALIASGQTLHVFLFRHEQGDRGDIPEEDKAANDRAIERGNLIRSLYHTRKGVALYLVTEGDRSETKLFTLEDE